MKREIKFRCWYSGRIVTVGSLQFFTDNTYLVNDELPVLAENLQIFTGLLDKNRKEIYEGDIVRVCWTSEKDDYTDCEILFDEKYLSYNFCEIGCEKPGNPLSELIDTRYDIEVISNIYEPQEPTDRQIERMNEQ